MGTIKKNFAYQALYEVLAIILPLITAPYVSRTLGAEGVGIYSYIATIADYFVLFAALGIKNYGNREIARNRNDQKKLNETFSSILYLHLIISSIVILACSFFCVYFVAEEYRLFIVIQTVSEFFNILWFYSGIEKFKSIAIRNLTIRILTLILIFALVKNPSDLWRYILILAIGNILGQLFLWVHLRRYVSICKVSKEKIFSHFPQMMVLFIPTIAISLYNYMDKIMLGTMSGKVQLGYYENSERMVFLVTNVVGALGTVMLPRMSNLVAIGDENKIKKYMDYSMQVVMCMSCAFFFGLAGISKVFAPVFWGKEFTDCAILIILLGITIPFKGFANVLRTQYLIPNRKDKEYTFSVSLGAIINLIVNFVLIPQFRSIGAAIGTIAAEICVCAFQMWKSRKELPLGDYVKKSIPYVVFGIIMFSIVYIIGLNMKPTVIVLLVQICVGAALYLGGCLIYFIKSKNKVFYEVILPTFSKRSKR